MASLPTKRPGSDGPEITRFGLGAWAIGGGGRAFGWGPRDDAASLATMRRAVALGINRIDREEKNRMGEIRRDLRPASIRRECEASPRRPGAGPAHPAA